MTIQHAGTRADTPPPPPAIATDRPAGRDFEDPLRGWLDKLAETWHAAADNSAEIKLVSERIVLAADDIDHHRSELHALRSEILRSTAAAKAAAETAAARAVEAGVAAQETASRSVKEALTSTYDAARLAVERAFDAARADIDRTVEEARMTTVTAAAEAAAAEGRRVELSLQDLAREIGETCRRAVEEAQELARYEASEQARVRGYEAAVIAAESAAALAAEKSAQTAAVATETIIRSTRDARDAIEALVRRTRDETMVAVTERAAEMALQVAGRTAEDSLKSLEDKARILSSDLTSMTDRALEEARLKVEESAAVAIDAAETASSRLAQLTVDRMAQEEAALATDEARQAAERAAAAAGASQEAQEAQRMAAESARSSSEAAERSADAAQEALARLVADSETQQRGFVELRTLTEAAASDAEATLRDSKELLDRVRRMATAINEKSTSTFEEVEALAIEIRHASSLAQGAARTAQAASAAAQEDARRAEKAAGPVVLDDGGRPSPWIDLRALEEDREDADAEDRSFLEVVPDQEVDADLYLDEGSEWRRKLRKRIPFAHDEGSGG